MSIINKYDTKSKYYIDKNSLISNFTENLDEKIERVTNFKYNKSNIYKIVHPFKAIKNNYEYTKLTNLKNDFQKVYDSNIMLYVSEESGILSDDLEYASRVVKPKYVEKYVKYLKSKK